MEEILDPKTGDLLSAYSNTHSRVTLSKKHNLHFKQAPSTPSKESPFHPGRERAASSLCSASLAMAPPLENLLNSLHTIPNLARKATWCQRSPKLSRAPILRMPLNKSFKPSNFQNLTDFFLSLPLLLPGDMRPANMIVDDRKLVSIDNDVSGSTP